MREPTKNPLIVALREAGAIPKTKYEQVQEQKKEEAAKRVKATKIKKPAETTAETKSTTVSDLNFIEELLQPPKQDRSDTDSLTEELAKREREKIEIVKKFLSNGIQKTDITATERKLIPLMYILAYNPFDLPDPEKHVHQELAGFIHQYIELGIPTGRKGRAEEVQILQSLFAQNTEIKQAEEGGVIGKIRKFGR